MQENLTQPTERLLTETEAAEIIGFSKNTLRAWRVSGRSNSTPPPQFLKCGRLVRYRLTDLTAWIDNQLKCRSTSNTGVNRSASFCASSAV